MIEVEDEIERNARSLEMEYPDTPLLASIRAAMKFVELWPGKAQISFRNDYYRPGAYVKLFYLGEKKHKDIAYYKADLSFKSDLEDIVFFEGWSGRISTSVFDRNDPVGSLKRINQTMTREINE